MRILVAEPNLNERKRLADLLRKRGHTVTTPATADAALCETQHDPPDLAFVNLAMGQPPGSLIASLRGAERDRHLYVIATSANPDGRAATAAWTSGADDLMRLSASAEEVLGRADAPTRIQAWSHRGMARVRDFAAELRLDRLQAWRNLEGLVSGELGSMLGVDLTVGSGSGKIRYAAEIPLSVPSEKVEIRLALGIDEGSVGPLGQQLFGDNVDSDAIDDALREMANMAGGAFKRHALDDGATFTLGLPKSRRPFSMDIGRCFAVCGPGFELYAAVTEAVRELRHLPARALTEGMVLAHDVKNVAGVLLLGAGTSLTRRSVERLIELVGPDTTLAVGDPTS